MKRLEKEHPAPYQHFKDGGFVVRRSSQRFDAVSNDQALEQMVNRDGKSQGGVIGLTLRKSALTRWLVTRHVTSEYADAFKSLTTDHNVNGTRHKELGKGRIVKDEEDVMKIVHILQDNQNPFDLATVPSELTNIITGRIASPEVTKSLSNFLDIGKRKHEEFMENRLLADTKTNSFWNTESRLKISTFSDMTKQLKLDNSVKLMMDPEVLFRRLLCVSKQQDVNLRKIMEHKLSAVPLTLYHDDGNMKKCTKADLAKKIEAACQEMHCLPCIEGQSMYMIEGMAFLQCQNETMFQSFDDLGKIVLLQLLSILKGKLGIDTVVLVFDRHNVACSIKQLERARRAFTVDDSTPSHKITGKRNVPNYHKFLKNVSNKVALAEFISMYLIENTPELLEYSQSILLVGGFQNGTLIKRICTSGISDEEGLYSSHEEADTRMLFHAISALDTHQRVIICCDDTDVLALLLYYYSMKMLPDLVYMNSSHTGKYTHRARFVPIHLICPKLGDSMCQAFPAMHALTGCDSTSSLHKVGKITAFRKLQQCPHLWPVIASFGIKDLNESLPTVQEYILSLHRKKKMESGALCSTLDDLRYIYEITTDKPAAAFPPTEDAFYQHAKCAHYQARIWCSSHIAKPELDDPIGNGWKIGQNGSMETVLYVKDPAPIEVRDLTHLYCRDELCNSPRKCHCAASGLRCTECCACGGAQCGNEKQMVIESDTDDEDNYDDDDNDVIHMS